MSQWPSAPACSTTLARGELADIFKANNVTVAGVQGLEIKKGLFGVGKLTDEKVKTATDFSTKIVTTLFEHIG